MIEKVMELNIILNLKLVYLLKVVDRNNELGI